VIHIVTSKNGPDWEIELNEAWVRNGGEPAGGALAEIEKYRETYPDGKLKATWSAGNFAGRYLLQGSQTFYFQNGRKQWESNYQAGNKVGAETWWNEAGAKRCERTYSADGVWDWKLFDSAGRVTAESRWKGKDLIDANPEGPLAR
jgi:antitoxin component YwqK of YwqJK toxin-antitoxin module